MRSQEALQQISKVKTQFNQAINNRNIAFSDLRSLSTRILNAFAASGANELIINDVKGFNRKIQGKRADTSKPQKDESGKEIPDTSISVSQLSFDNLIHHFKSIFETLAAEPIYHPNEKDLSLSALKHKIGTMTSTNIAAINVTTAMDNTLIARNNLLYDPKNGLISISTNVKKYIRSVFGANSEEIAQVNALTFSKPRGK